MKKAYQLFFSNKQLLRSSLAAFLLLIGSLIFNFYAGSYANEKGITPVTDIVLSNTKAYDVDVHPIPMSEISYADAVYYEIYSDLHHHPLSLRDFDSSRSLS